MLALAEIFFLCPLRIQIWPFLETFDQKLFYSVMFHPINCAIAQRIKHLFILYITISTVMSVLMT